MQFRASVEKSFKVATAEVDVSAAIEKELSETVERWRVDVDFTIAGAGVGGYMHACRWETEPPLHVAVLKAALNAFLDNATFSRNLNITCTCNTSGFYS